jgi:hypothetical protein
MALASSPNELNVGVATVVYAGTQELENAHAFRDLVRLRN